MDFIKKLIGPSEEEIAEEAEMRLNLVQQAQIAPQQVTRSKDPLSHQYGDTHVQMRRRTNPSHFPDTNPEHFNQDISQDQVIKYLAEQSPSGESLAYINPIERELLMLSGAKGKMTKDGVVSFAPEDPLKQAAMLLNTAAPKGEGLAYINQQEAQMLKDAGGAGEPVNSSGVPSFFLQKLFGGGKAPPPLPEFNVGKSARDYVGAMADSGLQDQMLGVRQQIRPTVSGFTNGACSTGRRSDGKPSRIECHAITGFWCEDGRKTGWVGHFSMLGRFGADLNQAYRASDPLMQARTNQANQLADQAFNEAQMTDLSPEMRRRATQSAREGLVSRGRGMDNAGIAAEAMSREDYLRDIIGQNRQQAQSLGSYASNLNRQTSVDPMAMLRGGSNYTAQGFGERSALFGMPQEQVTRINPDAGVNIGMQAYANKANYDSANYAARENAASGMAQGLFGAIGSLGGGYLSRGK